MKRFFSLAIAMAAFTGVYAQNIQLHYDLGHSLNKSLTSRQSVTTTAEIYKADKWGSTYSFIDIYYQRDGVSGAYWEFGRDLNITNNKQFAAHVEYNGGLNSDETTWQATRFQHAVLAGPAWNWHNHDYSSTFTVQTLYKYYFKNRHYHAHPYNSFQLTEVWGFQLAHHLVTLSGFCDTWYDPHVNGKWIITSQPQWWINLNAIKGCEVPLSLGGEVEVSNNFVYNDYGRNNRFYAIPTMALKWTF